MVIIHVYIDSKGYKASQSIIATINGKDQEFVKKKDLNDTIQIRFSPSKDTSDVKGHYSEPTNINNLQSLKYFTVYLLDQDLKQVTFYNKKFPIRIQISVHNVMWR